MKLIEIIGIDLGNTIIKNRRPLPHSLRVVGRLRERFGNDVHIVSLCLPNDLHCQATIDAARAGKHVICEKPLCMSLQEADQMIAACREAGVKLIWVVNPPEEPRRLRNTALAPVDNWLTRSRYLIIALTAGIVLIGAPALLKLQFDFDPLHLRSETCPRRGRSRPPPDPCQSPG